MSRAPRSSEPITAATSAASPAAAARDAEATTPSEPTLDPPTSEAGKLAAIDAVMTAEAIIRLQGLFEKCVEQIVALDTQVYDQSQDIKRLNAAVRALACPKGMPDPNTKDETAVLSIGACIDCGQCTCDVGHALVYAPPMPEQEYEELAPTPEGMAAPS